jgi:hypothetical protein
MPNTNNPTNPEQANPQNQPPVNVERAVDTGQLISAMSRFFSTFQNQSQNQTPNPFQDPDAQNAVNVFNDIVAGLQLKFVPDAPQLEAKTVSSNRVELKWSENTNNAEGFKVWRCVGQNCQDFEEIKRLPSNARAYADDQLSGGNTYRYKLSAFNSRGETFSKVVEAKI